MWTNAHDTYLESRILAADPIELVRVLYQAASGAVRDARHHLAAQDIAARSKSITKAFNVVTELATSLDRTRGGQIAEGLAKLYDYMLTRLSDANIQQADAPLVEVLSLLTTLMEGWDGVQTQLGAQTKAAPVEWSGPVEESHGYSESGYSAAGYSKPGYGAVEFAGAGYAEVGQSNAWSL